MVRRYYTINDLYKKNLKLLAQKNKGMADKLDNYENGKNDFNVINSKNITLEISFNNSKKLVHSKYRPQLQAKKRIATMELKRHNLIGVAGIGCGYYIEEMLNKIKRDSRFIIFENRLDILKEVMKNRNLETIFNSNNNIFILDGTNPNYINHLKTILQRIDFVSLAMGNIDFFKTPILKDKEEGKYKEFQNEYFSTISFNSQVFGNSSEDTLIGLDNILNNNEHLLKNQDFKKIEGFKDKPAVCVAAGPSLDKNIDVLKEYQDNVLIIACDTVLEKLLKNDIKPDIVSVLERVEKIYDYFFKDLIEKTMIPDKTVLIAEGVAHPKIFDNFPGEKVTVFRQNVPTERWFPEKIKDVQTIEAGNSVANLNFSIAHDLGASPIILMGQDLAYSKDGKAHTIETGYEEFGDEDLTEDNQDTVEVKGYNGETLKSKKWWKIFKQWFEFKIAKDNIHCIDATEGGAYIKGTKVMQLEKVADQYFTDEKLNFHEKLKSINDKNVYKTKANKFILSLENLREDIKSKRKEIASIRKKIPELRSKIKFDEKLKKLMKKYNEIDVKVSKLFFDNKFLYFILQPIFLNLKRNKVKIDNMELSSVERYKKLYASHYNKLLQSEKVINKTLNILSFHLDDLKQKYNKKDDQNEGEYKSSR